MFSAFCCHLTILGALVSSGRPPPPLDAGMWGQPLFSKVLAESGGDESFKILQEGASWNQKRKPKGGPKYIKKSMRFQERKKVSAGQCFGAILMPLGRFWLPFWCPLDFGGRSARCFSMYLTLPNKFTNHIFFDSCASKIGKIQKNEK